MEQFISANTEIFIKCDVCCVGVTSHVASQGRQGDGMLFTVSPVPKSTSTQMSNTPATTKDNNVKPG
jgi:hypothetical protein